LFILCVLGAQKYAEHKIEVAILKALPKEVQVDYKGLDVNIFSSAITLTEPKIEIGAEAADDDVVQLEAQQIRLDGIGIWVLWSDRIGKADALSVNGGNLKISDTNADTPRFSIWNMSVKLKDIETDSVKLKSKIPFAYKELVVNVDSLYTPISPYEHVSINRLSLKEGALKTGKLSITSNYDAAELSKKLKNERDYIKLNILNSMAEDFRVVTTNDSIEITSTKLTFERLKAILYRDKRIADNVDEKLLYGAMLRNLPIKIDIKTVLLDEGHISYSEKVEEEVEPSSIVFEDIHAEIQNISNSNPTKTQVKATAALMGEAPIALDFSFRVQDPSHRFIASATLADMDADIINPFLVSNAKVKAKGRIDELYFTISGNNQKSTGDMKMKYKDFEFSVLDDNRLGINKTVTTIVNLFANDGSKSDVDGYRYGVIEVERDRTKSFFNYLWLNTKDGLKNTVTGNGKKKD
jgi:hypothetical protein